MSKIPGLYYIPEYLTKKEIKKITKYLNGKNKWVHLPNNPHSRQVPLT